ncbi:MAG: RT0821/Lpp0805 family surface protein [Nitratireductor sp.]
MRLNLLIALACGLLSGCTTTSLGRVTPGLLSTASIEKAMDGGLIGGELGMGLSARDRRLALQAEYTALEHTPGGKPVTWKSDGGAWTGAVTAAQPYRVGSQDCRQYTHAVTGTAGMREARGTACRNEDGSWTPLT